MRQATKIQLEKRRRRMRHGEYRRRPTRDTAEDSEKSGAEDPKQNCAMEFSRHQDQREAEPETGRLHFLVGEAAETDKGGGIGDDQLGIPQSDESDEHSYSSGGRMLQAIGNAVHNLLANRSEEHT